MTRLDDIRARDAEAVPSALHTMELGAFVTWAQADRRWLLEHVDRMREALKQVDPWYVSDDGEAALAELEAD